MEAKNSGDTMNPRMLFSMVMATMSLAFAVGCSTTKKEKKSEGPVPTVESKDINNALKSDQVDFATLEFDRGEALISDMDRRHLNELAVKMTDAGKVVDDIKILTWSDRTVSTDDEATNTEIILARQRAESIKNYLDKTLPEEEDVDFYNMAENPKRYENYMTRKGIHIEDAFSEEGKEMRPDGRALVIIEYKSGPMPSTL